MFGSSCLFGPVHGCVRFFAVFIKTISHPIIDRVTPTWQNIVIVVDPVDMNSLKDDGYPIVDLDSDIEGGER